MEPATMKRYLKKITRSFLQKFNFDIVNNDDLKNLRSNRSDKNDIALLKALNRKYTGQILDLLEQSKSQLRQDIFVLSELDFKKDGYFVEFGATNGVDLSNTYLMETNYNWQGILAEPAKTWHVELKQNRRAKLEFKCVWSKSDATLEFIEANVAELSTITEFSDKDFLAKKREGGKAYGVQTITLLDLLKKHGAPKKIDYLSIDTEGSEFEILNAFDFSAYQFGVITCEHNFTPERDKIYALLTSHGYVRKLENVSNVDDWYVKQ
jgi:FkbM family methyltransferase